LPYAILVKIASICILQEDKMNKRNRIDNFFLVQTTESGPSTQASKCQLIAFLKMLPFTFIVSYLSNQELRILVLKHSQRMGLKHERMGLVFLIATD
jgi:hypothetical protein